MATTHGILDDETVMMFIATRGVMIPN
jgi:hypothetical protein